MKKILGWIAGIVLIGVAVGAVLTFVFIKVIDHDGSHTAKGNNNEEVSNHDVDAADEEDAENETDDSEEESGDNPFGDQIDKGSMNDRKFNDYIHEMSHQKVKADAKRGFYEITDERIDWLLKALDKSDPQHKDTYKGILDKWKEGDFSTADQDHNAVWELLDGEVGKATGVMSDEEEKEYVESKK